MFCVILPSTFNELVEKLQMIVKMLHGYAGSSCTRLV